MNTSHPNDPLHAGEIFHLWSYLHGTKAFIVTMQVLINHTEDQQLKDFLEDVLESCFIQEEQQVEGLLKETGIRLPPAPPNRPNVDIADIPAGARFNDPEIPELLQHQLISSRLLCSYITGISLRHDIRTMFQDFHSQKAEYEQKLIELTNDKGWLVLPPIQTK